MNEIQRLYYINLAVSSDSPDELLAEVASFYCDFLGMVGVEVPVNEISGSYEDQERALAPFGDLYELDGKNMDVALQFLRGAESGPEATCIDLQRYRHPTQNTRAAELPFETGLRSPTFLVDDLDAVYRRGLAQGKTFVSEPVSMNLVQLGDVRFGVVIDPAGNRVELLQVGEAAGDGGVLRIFSININCADVNASLDFYRDVLGMKLETEIDFGEHAAWGSALGAGNDVQARSFYLRGHQEEAPTYLSLTGWTHPQACKPNRQKGRGNNWFRMCLWATADDIDGAIYERCRTHADFLAPPGRDDSAMFGESCLAVFRDPDGVIQELAYSSSWQGF